MLDTSAMMMCLHLGECLDRSTKKGNLQNNHLSAAEESLTAFATKYYKTAINRGKEPKEERNHNHQSIMSTSSNSTSSNDASIVVAQQESYIVDEYSSFIASTAMMTTATTSKFLTALLPSMDPRIVSGSVSSVLSAVVSQPFEVAKVKQQTTSYASGGYHLASSSGVHQQSSPGAISTLRHLIRTEGIRGAYAGMAPTVMMSIPNYVLYLTAYDDIVARLRTSSSVTTTTTANHNRLEVSFSENTIPLIGGALARLLATTAVAPLEMLRTRHASRGATHTSTSHGGNASAASRKQSTSMVSEVSKIVRQEGFIGLYRGILPSLGRDVPFAAIYMLFLERFREASRPILFANSSSISRSPGQQVAFEFINAAAAGMVAASCTAPLDVIKTRAMTATRSSNNTKPAMTTLRVVQSIVHQEGLAGLWRGNQARMMKVAPQYAIMISLYEVGKNILATADDETF